MGSHSRERKRSETRNVQGKETGSEYKDEELVEEEESETYFALSSQGNTHNK